MSTEYAKQTHGLPLRVGKSGESDGAPRGSHFNGPRRKDVSWRYATEANLECFDYTISLGRWTKPEDLSKRAVRVLRFFAALNRTGKHGFKGTRCRLKALAAAIRRATDEACSVSTLQRALKELSENEYTDISHVYGNNIIMYGGRKRREQIDLITLTPKATNLWSSHTRPHRSKCHTPEGTKPDSSNQSYVCTRNSVNLKSNDKVSALPAKQSKPEPQPNTIAPSTPTNREGLYTPAGTRRAILQYIACFLKYQGRLGKVILARISIELGEGAAYREERSGYDWNKLVKAWWRLKQHQRDIAPLSTTRNSIVINKNIAQTLQKSAPSEGGGFKGTLR